MNQFTHPIIEDPMMESLSRITAIIKPRTIFQFSQHWCIAGMLKQSLNVLKVKWSTTFLSNSWDKKHQLVQNVVPVSMQRHENRLASVIFNPMKFWLEYGTIIVKISYGNTHRITMKVYQIIIFIFSYNIPKVKRPGKQTNIRHIQPNYILTGIWYFNHIDPDWEHT